MRWSHVAKIALVSYTSNIPPHDVIVWACIVDGPPKGPFGTSKPSSVEGLKSNGTFREERKTSSGLLSGTSTYLDILSFTAIRTLLRGIEGILKARSKAF